MNDVFCSFSYMTELDTIEEQGTLEIEAKGHDLQSALFGFLDEWLFNFSAEPNFIPFKIEITEFDRSEDDITIKGKTLTLKRSGFL